MRDKPKTFMEAIGGKAGHRQPDLFGGETAVPTPNKRVWPRPDQSPRRRRKKGERACHECKHFHRFSQAKVYVKCKLTSTSSSATDIGVFDVACAAFEEA